jgi:hypothetical protein
MLSVINYKLMLVRGWRGWMRAGAGRAGRGWYGAGRAWFGTGKAQWGLAGEKTPAVQSQMQMGRGVQAAFGFSSLHPEKTSLYLIK